MAVGGVFSAFIISLEKGMSAVAPRARSCLSDGQSDRSLEGQKQGNVLIDMFENLKIKDPFILVIQEYGV